MNGERYTVQMEPVPVNAAGNENVVRPIIRLPEKNLVLTRINPEVRTLCIVSVFAL